MTLTGLKSFCVVPGLALDKLLPLRLDDESLIAGILLRFGVMVDAKDMGEVSCLFRGEGLTFICSAAWNSRLCSNKTNDVRCLTILQCKQIVGVRGKPRIYKDIFFQSKSCNSDIPYIFWKSQKIRYTPS